MEFKNGTTAAKYRASVELLQVEVEDALLSCLMWWLWSVKGYESRCMPGTGNTWTVAKMTWTGRRIARAQPSCSNSAFIHDMNQKPATVNISKGDGIYVSFTDQNLDLLVRTLLLKCCQIIFLYYLVKKPKWHPTIEPRHTTARQS